MSRRRQRVLITGGAVRIGAALAGYFAEKGYEVAIQYGKSKAAAEKLVKGLPEGGKRHRAFFCDLSSGEARISFWREVTKQWGMPDVLINNAAAYDRGFLGGGELCRGRELYEVNFWAPVQLMQLFWEGHRKSRRPGAIVNLLDQRVAITEPAAGFYGMSKKSLRDATEIAALEWAREKISVAGVAPGVVLPPPGGSEEKMKKILGRIPTGRTVPLGELCDSVFFLATHPQTTGNILYLDGALHLTSPAETAPFRS